MKSRTLEVEFLQENGERVVIRWSVGSEQIVAADIWNKRCLGQIPDQQVRYFQARLEDIALNPRLPRSSRQSFIDVICLLHKYRRFEEHHHG